MRVSQYLVPIMQKIAYFFAICIVMAALILSISRTLTPILDQHRQDFEKWASQLLNMPVQINQVRVSWYQYQPEMSLNEVTILNSSTKKPILQIKTIRVF